MNPVYQNYLDRSEFEQLLEEIRLLEDRIRIFEMNCDRMRANGYTHAADVHDSYIIPKYERKIKDRWKQIDQLINRND